MKKLFHRKKNSAPSSPEQTPPRLRNADNVNTDPSIRTSRYESTASAGLPQTGQYPLKGNNSSVALQGRRSETYSRGQASGTVEPSPRPSSSSPYYGSLPAPRVASASYDRPFEGFGLNDYHREHINTQNSPLIQDFSGLNLHSTDGQTDNGDLPHQQHQERSTFTADSSDAGYRAPRQERHVYRDESPPGLRMVNRAEPSQLGSGPTQQRRNGTSRDQDKYDYFDSVRGHSSIYPPSNAYGDDLGANATSSRKSRNPHGGAKPATQTPSINSQPALSSSNSSDPRRHRIAASSTSASGLENSYGIRQEGQNRKSNMADELHRSPGVVQPSAQQAVDRAGHDTYDTEVVEKVAPGTLIHISSFFSEFWD
ncbi:MAG: hypothetical protein Q9179_005831 [Wetmoreana sp. 5 TL-2023]